MTPPIDSERTRLLRAYLLGTLPPTEHERVQGLIEQNNAWRSALEDERAALSLLDALRAEPPPIGLAKSVIAAAERDEESVLRKRQVSWMAIGGVVVVVGIIFAVMLPSLARAREAARRASDQNNMKQLGLIFKMYANESKGEKYPPITPYPGIWMFDLRTVYPEFITDLSVLVNPSLPDSNELLDKLKKLAAQNPIDWESMTKIAARSYTYTGWDVISDGDFKQLASVRARLSVWQLDQDIQAEGKQFHRLREGVERFSVSDINNPAASVNAQAALPILFNTQPSGHLPEGGNVLYMDGHVSFHRDFPNISPFLK